MLSDNGKRVLEVMPENQFQEMLFQIQTTLPFLARAFDLDMISLERLQDILVAPMLKAALKASDTNASDDHLLASLGGSKPCFKSQVNSFELK